MKTQENPSKKARQIRRRRRHPRTGASAVEFALVFPLIILFFICSVAFTQAFLLKDVAQHAAYRGVRKGIIWDANNDDVEKEVDDFLAKMGVRKAKVTTVPKKIDNSVNEITVRVEIPMKHNAWVLSPLMPGNFTPGSEVTINRRDRE